MNCRRNWGVASLLALFLSLALPAWAADDLVVQGKKLLDSGSAQAAYDMLKPHESERAGDPEFDYLLGVAALDIGHNTEAVFALERVLAVQPNSAPARAQIARAYFALKETDTAKREFENVKKQDVPPEVRETIDRYLDAIERVGEAEKFKARFFIEFAAGYDSNVNSATQVENIAVPAFNNLVFTLAPASQQKDDGFISFSAGMNINGPIGNGWSVIGGLSAYQRNNFNQQDFNTAYLDGYIGVAKRYARDTFTLVGQGNIFFVDDPQFSQEFRDALGGTFQWTHDFDARNQLTAYVQYADLTYPEQSPRDANRYIGGVGYAHAFRGGDPIVYAGVYGGSEKTKDEAFDYLGNHPIGLRLGGQKNLSDTWLAFFNAAAEWRKYQGVDPTFLLTRDDKMYSAGLGLTWLFTKNWRLSPQVSYLFNESNISINQYHRTQVFVTLRTDF
jgi:tetratricopeptide (TPR) repeat protein